MRILPADAYGQLDTPESWDNVTEFAEWYMKSGAPMLPPWGAPIIRTDDATALCLFRKGQYQVELYLIHPGMVVPPHGHPGMETLLVTLGGGELGTPEQGGTSDSWGKFSPVLKDGDVHGGGKDLDICQKGFAVLAFQHWQKDHQVTSAAVRWCGPTAGPLHDALIRQHHPDSIALAGFADVRATAPSRVI